MEACELQIENLSCERDDRLLFDRLHAGIQPGKAYQIEGPNGSGKTTLIRILCGLYTDYQGRLIWQDQLLAGAQWDVWRAQLLYLGHQTGTKQALTPEENLTLSLATHSQSPRCTITEALAQIGLRGFEDLPCYQLSAGQKRRVALARLYLESSPIWILDEPFTAIDLAGVAKLEQRLAEHVEGGGTVIFTTHHEVKLSCALEKIGLGLRHD